MPDERRSYDADIAEIKTLVKANTEMTKQIHTTIHGNGSDGLKTKVALNRQAIKKQWYFIGSISLAILTGAISLVYFCFRMAATT